MNISQIFTNAQTSLGQKKTINGWIVTARVQSHIAFISVNDGSCQRSIQIVMDLKEDIGEEQKLKLKTLTKGVCITINGEIVESPAKGQFCELHCKVEDLNILGEVDPGEYPLSKKKHSLEYIRSFPHLRVRTNTFGMVARVRNTCTLATHEFFQKNGFINVHAPIITSNDCEGAGETFTITNSLKDNISEIPIIKDSNGKIDYEKDFFGKKAFLTVSSQLQGESYAMGLSRIYIFGPTFRAENSFTSRHLSEFWMIEPEAAFISFKELMDLAEEYIKYCIHRVLNDNMDDIDFINKRILKGHKKTLEDIYSKDFKRISYTEAIEVLQQDYTKKSPYEKVEEWGCDLHSDQEKYLTSKFGPTIVYNYPKKIKSFYMKENEDGKTVQAMDVLVPGIGELIGGSMREENYDKLLYTMNEKGVNPESLSWYLDLRKYGSAPHGGFGLGFERLIMLISGLTNIRDCIPFPRYPKHCLN